MADCEAVNGSCWRLYAVRGELGASRPRASAARAAVWMGG